MTAIGQDRAPRFAITGFQIRIALIAALTLFLVGFEFATIVDQHRMMVRQHAVIVDMSGIIDRSGYKFADGFLSSCGTPCVIRDNGGGNLKDFEWLASLVRVREKTILIDGYCASACALFADRARAFVRITDRASFWFHQASNNTDPPHSPDIVAWVKANGGYPTQASGNLTIMDFSVARRFWQPAFDWQRMPFDLNAPRPWAIAGLRGAFLQ